MSSAAVVIGALRVNQFSKFCYNTEQIGKLLLEWHLVLKHILYFFGYKMEFVSFRYSPKNLHPSYKMDLDLWDCLGMIYLNFIELI